MAFSARINQSVILLLVYSTFIGITPIYAETTLTMEYAVKSALKSDELTNVYRAQRDAYKEQSIADDVLPDPKIKFGLMNIPTDTYSRNQEPMTQLQIGVQQMFPRGDSLEIKSQRTLSMSSVENAKVENQIRKVRREVREAWLEIYYWLNAETVIKKNRKLFSELVSVTKQQYASGRQKQQDVIRSELELGMLEDREINIKFRLEEARSKLSKFIGRDAFNIKLGKLLPVLSLPKKQLIWLDTHPIMVMQQAMVNINKKNILLAKQNFKPSWMLDVTYGKREATPTGAERADFVSAMVLFDLPLFTNNNQDKKVAANKYRLNGALSNMQERKRELTRSWNIGLAKEKRLAQRNKHYQSVLVPKSVENRRAALFSYQSGRGEFSSLMRAQIIELETQLRALRLKVDYIKTQALLLYLAGENNAASATTNSGEK